MKLRSDGNPYDFDGEPGETATLTISPFSVGNTFVVSKPAELISGGGPGDEKAEFRYTLKQAAGEVQVIRMMFNFLEPIGDSLTPATWPRFEIVVQGDKGDTTPRHVPDVFQSSVDPVPSEQTLDLTFRVVASETRSLMKPERERSAKKRTVKKRTTKKRTAKARKTDKTATGSLRATAKSGGKVGKARKPRSDGQKKGKN